MRHLRAYYIVEPDEAGAWSAQELPILHQSTASFAPGFARPLASAPPPDVSPAWTSGALNTGGAEDDGSGTVASGEDAGAHKGTPFLPIAATIAALGLIAPARRRR